MADVGTIYLCATPIGNLEDITLRVLRILQEVDFIAAEDTRHTLKLLNHFDIKKPLISYHEHNKRERGRELIDLARSGKHIALVSDAGMPGISDPGYDLVVLCREESIPVTVLPGPSAVLASLVLSGLPTDKFVFEGFLSKDRRRRIQEIEGLARERRTIILYESPHRLKTTLKELHRALGDRQVALVRELTKIHEEVLQMSLSAALEYYQDREVRGEFVLVLEGYNGEENEAVNPMIHMDIPSHVRAYMELGMEKKEAIKRVARERKLPKNQVYQESLDI
jgi:16S rRNA (cytidine1402-2'-O)-methyltransferase